MKNKSVAIFSHLEWCLNETYRSQITTWLASLVTEPTIILSHQKSAGKSDVKSFETIKDWKRLSTKVFSPNDNLNDHSTTLGRSAIMKQSFVNGFSLAKLRILSTPSAHLIKKDYKWLLTPKLCLSDKIIGHHSLLQKIDEKLQIKALWDVKSAKY